MEVLFQWLLEMWEEVVPFYYLAPDQRGVQWRAFPGIGRLHKYWPKFVPENGIRDWEVGPGIHWKFPFFDSFGAEVIKPRYLDLDNITAESADKVAVLISLSIKFWIHNVRKALLEVEDFEKSLVIDAQNIVVVWVESHNYADIKATAMIEACTSPIKAAALEWGCKVREVGVNSRARHKLQRFLLQ